MKKFILLSSALISFVGIGKSVDVAQANDIPESISEQTTAKKKVIVNINWIEGVKMFDGTPMSAVGKKYDYYYVPGQRLELKDLPTGEKPKERYVEVNGKERINVTYLASNAIVQVRVIDSSTKRVLNTIISDKGTVGGWYQFSEKKLINTD